MANVLLTRQLSVFPPLCPAPTDGSNGSPVIGRPLLPDTQQAYAASDICLFTFQHVACRGSVPIALVQRPTCPPFGTRAPTSSRVVSLSFGLRAAVWDPDLIVAINGIQIRRHQRCNNQRNEQWQQQY